MRILHINSVCGVTGTGRIVADLCREANVRGHHSMAAYGEHKFQNQGDNIETLQIGTKWDCYIHGLLTRLFDLQGFGSISATRKFLKRIDEYQPDVIHLHNLHGYYINIKLLFDYIKRKKIKTVWTLHDCWPMTGHCVHFENVSCTKWKEQCYKCPLKRDYPASYLTDNSRWNYRKKKEAFQGVEDMIILVPSEWMAEKVKESFLKDYPIKVIYNGIDTQKYCPVESDFKQKHGIGDKIVILGVANIWNERKGLKVFVELSELLDDTFKIVLIGLTKEQIQELPTNIIGIERTDTVEELAKAYTAADIFVTPSTEETFGLTIAEAVACGTWPIVYEGTACAEVVKLSIGEVVPRKVVELKKAIVKYSESKKEEDLEKYAQFFSKQRFAQDILEIYQGENR